MIGNNSREIHAQFPDEKIDSETEIAFFFMATFIDVIPLSDTIMAITIFCLVK